MDYTSISVGTKATWTYSDFDGRGTLTGTVTETHPDHLIVEAEGEVLWCDDNTVDMFEFFTT